MNIIITNFTQKSQTPVESASQKISSSLNEGTKSLDKAEGITMKGQEKIDNSLKTENPRQKPQKNDTKPISKHNPSSSVNSGIGTPNKETRIPPIVVDNNSNNNSVASKTGWQARLENPSVIRSIDLDTSISGAGDSVFVGNLKSEEKRSIEMQNKNSEGVAYLRPRQKYNTYMNVTANNATTPSQLAGLSGVWKV